MQLAEWSLNIHIHCQLCFKSSSASCGVMTFEVHQQMWESGMLDGRKPLTVGYLLEVFIRLWIPSMVCIFTSAWS